MAPTLNRLVHLYGQEWNAYGSGFYPPVEVNWNGLTVPGVIKDEGNTIRFTLPDNVPPGRYTVTVCVGNTPECSNELTATITDGQRPRDQPCEPWATPDEAQLCGPCGVIPPTAREGGTSGILDAMLIVASTWLWRLTGRQYGVCPVAVLPLGGQTCCPPSSGLHYFGGCYFFDRHTNCYWDAYGRMSRGEGVPEIRLGFENVQEVTSVLIDGEMLDPSAYRVDDARWLVRTDGLVWPSQTGAGTLTIPPTFEVWLTHGIPVPPDGRLAAATLACELTRGCEGDKECRLPRRLTSVTRQGVSMVVMDPMTFLSEGRFGIAEIDMFIRSANPHMLDRRAMVFSPDTPRPVRIVTSP